MCQFWKSSTELDTLASVFVKGFSQISFLIFFSISLIFQMKTKIAETKIYIATEVINDTCMCVYSFFQFGFHRVLQNWLPNQGRITLKNSF